MAAATSPWLIQFQFHCAIRVLPFSVTARVGGSIAGSVLDGTGFHPGVEPFSDGWSPGRNPAP